MQKSQDEIVNLLNLAGLRPSLQRIKILNFILNNNLHPTVDDIYAALKKNVPSLSKATVYNTVNKLVECNLINQFKIDGESESRYEAMAKLHAHFTCKNCHAVYDIMLEKEFVDLDHINGFEIDSKKVCMKGTCPKCK